MPTALYIDTNVIAFDYGDVAREIATQMGYEWLEPFFGATSIVADSQFNRSLLASAIGADLLLLRFSVAPLTAQWAFGELSRLREHGGRIVAMLDGGDIWSKRHLDRILREPSFVINSPSDMAATLAATISKVQQT